MEHRQCAQKGSSGLHALAEQNKSTSNALNLAAVQKHARDAAAQKQPSSPTPPPLPVLDSVQHYEKLHRIGEGTYGVVYKARHIPTGQIVALKKVRFDHSREGLPVTSMRELAILQAAQHPNIVKLLRVVTGTRPDSVFLVFEYAEHDLGRVLDAHGARAFSEGEAKRLFSQLASAVAALHDSWVLHRDLKLSNLLYGDDGSLKLCDFGLARHYRPDGGGGRLTPVVVTLWYRAPELLLGTEAYGPAIDCWALGCILGELLRGAPLFPASSEAEAVSMHCALLGSPTPRIWPAMRLLPHANRFAWPEQPFNFLRRTFPELSPAGLALLNGLLTYDADQRLTARQALEHSYLRERPHPRRLIDMPRFPCSHPAPPSHGGAGAAGHVIGTAAGAGVESGSATATATAAAAAAGFLRGAAANAAAIAPRGSSAVAAVAAAAAARERRFGAAFSSDLPRGTAPQPPSAGTASSSKRQRTSFG